MRTEDVLHLRGLYFRVVAAAAAAVSAECGRAAVALG